MVVYAVKDRGNRANAVGAIDTAPAISRVGMNRERKGKSAPSYVGYRIGFQ